VTRLACDREVKNFLGYGRSALTPQQRIWSVLWPLAAVSPR
jgi:hypothetical protein